MKKCPLCNEIKELSCFRRPPSRIGGAYNSYCKPCENNYQKEWRKASLSHQNTKSKKNRRGLTLDGFNLIVIAQDNKCDICKKKPNEKRSLDLDHNHRTNENRGLLCNNCNRGLGHFKDDVSNLENAIKYLKKWD